MMTPLVMPLASGAGIAYLNKHGVLKFILILEFALVGIWPTKWYDFFASLIGDF